MKKMQGKDSKEKQENRLQKNPILNKNAMKKQQSSAWIKWKKYKWIFESAGSSPAPAKTLGEGKKFPQWKSH